MKIPVDLVENAIEVAPTLTADERTDLENGGWLRFFEHGDYLAEDLVAEATARGEKLVEAGEPIPAAAAEAIYTAVDVATVYTLATKIARDPRFERLPAEHRRHARAYAARSLIRTFAMPALIGKAS
jgi:hypothetical protein